MTQIVVTLENGADTNLIQHIIENIKGVFKTSLASPSSSIQHKNNEKTEWMKQINELTGSFDPNLIDLEDERTKYLMNK